MKLQGLKRRNGHQLSSQIRASPEQAPQSRGYAKVSVTLNSRQKYPESHYRNNFQLEPRKGFGCR